MTKSEMKKIKKAAKKNPKAAIIIIILLLVVAIATFVIYKVTAKPANTFNLNGPEVASVSLNGEYNEKGVTAKYKNEDVSDRVVITYHKDSIDGPVVEEITTNENATFYVVYSISIDDWSETIERQVVVGGISPLEIYFVDLQNSQTGDCTYIKSGDVDILVDAGSNAGSAARITSFLKQTGHVDDGKLEYVIATHAHEDHIAGFVGTSSIPSVLDQFEIENIIKYSKQNTTSSLSSNFNDKIAEKVDSGTNLLLAKDIIESGNTVFNIAQGITMEVLNQRFYKDKSSDENNYSVCTLFTQGENHYLFTGDLEAEGESSLVDTNPDLPHVNLFKGGHHGSYTASSDKLLNKITPDIVCVCCCAGNNQYTSDVLHQFPAQEFLDRVAKHTDAVYVTTVTANNSAKNQPMNGTILVYCPTGSQITVKGTNNNLKLKDQEWFKNQVNDSSNPRYCPSQWL